jgi:predicted NACHT family NTPase
MLDGLDEVPEAQREKVSRWINWQMQNYASVFILTRSSDTFGCPSHSCGGGKTN